MSIQAIVEPPSKSDNRRGTVRWRIRLEMTGALDDKRARLVIHDISTAGMLIETQLTLEVGQSIMLSLPEADSVIGSVVWQNGPLFGCRFDQPMPQAVVSAVRLRNPNPHDVKPGCASTEMKVREELPGRLRRLRQERGLSRAALCEQTGFSKPTVWGWETGMTTPRKENLRILAGIFGLNEQQLLFGGENDADQDFAAKNSDAYIEA